MNLQELQSLSEIDQVAYLLRQTFINPDTKQRQECEKLLDSFKANMIKFTEVLVSILISPDTQYINDSVVKSASNYLNLMISAKKPDADPESMKLKEYQAELFLTILLKDTYTLNRRTKVKRALKELLSSTKTDPMKVKLLELSLQAIAAKNSTSVGGLLALQCVIDNLHNREDIVQFTERSIAIVVSYGESLIDTIMHDLSTLATVGGVSDQQKEAAFNIILFNLEVLGIWGDTAYFFSKKLNDTQEGDLQILVKHEAILTLIFKILFLQINDQHQISDCVISTCSAPKINTFLNDLKNRALKILNILSMHVFERLKAGDKSSANFLELVAKVLILALTSLINFCKTDKFDIFAKLNEMDLECLITEILQFLTVCCAETYFYSLFAEQKRVLVIDIIFPFMRLIDSEKAVMQEKPEDFVHLSNDCCDKQITGIFKSQAAQFLEFLCNHIDGTLTFVAVMALNLIDFSLSSSLEQIGDYNMLKDFKDTLIIGGTDKEARLEASLLVLSILSFAIPKRADLMMLLETTIAKYHDVFVNSQNFIVRSRYCLLISQYLESIFKDPKLEEVYYKLMGYLVDSVALPSPDYDIVSIQACEGLKKIVHKKAMEARVAPIIGVIVEKFSTYIDIVTHMAFFETFNEALVLYSEIIANNPDLIILIMKRFILVIVEET
eukprot:CAMPEP_0176468830 /NCGR_PEP_ID=MMETSP0127-20121128/39381_1 /TAXON_ID=938130 /ORGANISM="Platyophrya macrostoma, Strain WH" /LENGTH=669 /DNA_ID=CAMNT_0017862583 /DNA_START=63 /DNA_END=2069 /DNA_ORIENTATION=-